ncbi:MAG: hypothetical protein PVG60_05805, partial [Desulfarculaceae bacterium]
RLEPKNHLYYYSRGVALAFQNRLTEAMADTEMALSLDPKNLNYRKAIKDITARMAEQEKRKGKASKRP